MFQDIIGQSSPLLIHLMVKVSILVIQRKGPKLIPDSRQSACRWQHA